MSAAVLAGAMSFSSCSNDENGEVEYGNGAKAEAQMAISFQRFAKDGKGVAGDVNLGTDGQPALLQSIENLVIMPGKGNNFVNAVRLGGLTVAANGTITPDGLTEKTEGSEYYTSKTVSLAEGTNAVKFFGGDVWANGALKATVTYEGAITDGAPTAEATKTYYKMPKLYYYGLDTELQYSDQAYKDVTTWETLTGGAGLDADVKSIKVDNINYAVGSLVSTVKMSGNAKHLFVAPDYDISKITDKDGQLTVPTGDDQKPSGNPIEIVGYIINGQQASVSVADGFVPGATAGTSTVYDAVVADDKAITTTATVKNYTRLFATPATQEAVQVVLRCKNASQYALVSRNVSQAGGGYGIGLIAPDSDFYLVVSLNKGAGTNNNGAPSIIAQDYTTTANFTINSTFNAYDKDPDVKTVDATVGVVVDLSWQAGYTFDTEID